MQTTSKGVRSSKIHHSRVSSLQHHAAASNSMGSSSPSEWSPDVSHARQALGRIKARRSAESAMFLNSILKNRVPYDSLSSPEHGQTMLSWGASVGQVASPLDPRKNVDEVPPFSPASFLSPPLNRSMLETRSRDGMARLDEEVDYIKQLAAEELDGLSSYALLGIHGAGDKDQVSQSPQMTARLAYALEQSQSDYKLLRARQELFQHLIHKTINENLNLVSEQKESLETLHDSITLGKGHEKTVSSLIRTSLQYSSRMHLALLNLRDSLVKEKLGIRQIKSSRVSASNSEAIKMSQDSSQETRNGNYTVQLALEQAKEKARSLEARLTEMNEDQEFSQAATSSRYAIEAQLYIEKQLVESLQAASSMVGDVILTNSGEEQKSFKNDEFTSSIPYSNQNDRISSFLDANAMERLKQLDGTIKLLVTKLQQSNKVLKENQSFVKNLENEMKELEDQNRELRQELNSSQLQVRVLKKELEESFEQVERQARLGERSSETNVALRREVDRLRSEVQILSRANLLESNEDFDHQQMEVTPAADQPVRAALPYPCSNFSASDDGTRVDSRVGKSAEQEETSDDENDEEVLQQKLSENQTNMIALSAKLRQSIQDWHADRMIAPPDLQPCDPDTLDESLPQDEQEDKDEMSIHGGGGYQGSDTEDTGVILYIRHEYPVGQALDVTRRDSNLSRSILSTVAEALGIRDNWMKIKDISPCDDFWEISPATKRLASEGGKPSKTSTFKVTLVLCNEETTGVSSMWILAEMQRQLGMPSGPLLSHDHPFRVLSVCDLEDGDQRFADLPPEGGGGRVHVAVQECDRDWEHELHDLRMEIQELKESLDTSRRQHAELVTQSDALKNKYDDLLKEAEVRGEEQHRHQTAVAVARKLAADLQQSLVSMEVGLREWHDEMSSLLSKSEQDRSERIRGEGEMTRLQEEWSRREGELEEKNRKLECSVAELEERVADLDRCNEECTLRCSTSERTVRDLKLQGEDLSRRNSELAEVYRALQEWHSILCSSLEEHTDRLDELCESFGALGDVGVTVQRMRQERAAEKKLFAVFLSKLKTELMEDSPSGSHDPGASDRPPTQLPVDMEDVLERMVQLKRSLEVQREEVAGLHTSYEQEKLSRRGDEMNQAEHAQEHSRELKISSTKISEQETKISEQETKISEQETKISEQETKISEQETKISEQETKISQLEASVTQKSEEESELRAELEDRVKEIALVQQHCESLKEEVDELKVKAEEQDKTIGGLRETLEERQIMNNDLEEMLFDERQFSFHFTDHYSDIERTVALIDELQTSLLPHLQPGVKRTGDLEAALVSRELQLQATASRDKSAGEGMLSDRLLVLDSIVGQVQTLLSSCTGTAEQALQARLLAQTELMKHARSLQLVDGYAHDMLSQLLMLQEDSEMLCSAIKEQQQQTSLGLKTGAIKTEEEEEEEEDVAEDGDDVVTLQDKLKAMRARLDVSRSDLLRMEKSQTEKTAEMEKLREECRRLQEELDSADQEHSRDLEKAHSALTAARLAAEHEVRRNGAGSVVDEVERQHKRFSRASSLLGRYILDSRTVEHLLAIACPLTRQLVSCEVCVVYLLLSDKSGGLVLRALVSDKVVEQYAARMMEAILPGELQKSESNLSSNDSWEKEGVTHLMDVRLDEQGLLLDAIRSEQAVLVESPGEDARYDAETDGAYMTRWTVREDKEVGPMACVPVQWPNGEVVGVLQACRWKEEEGYNAHDVDILHEAARLVGLRHQALADESRQYTESCRLAQVVLEGGMDNMRRAEEELRGLKEMCVGLCDRVETLKSYSQLKTETRTRKLTPASPADLLENEHSPSSPGSSEHVNDRTLETTVRQEVEDKAAEDEEELFEMEERFDKNIAARALFDYKASEIDELDIEAGSSMMLVGLAQEGWYVAKQHGKLGLVPANYVERM